VKADFDDFDSSSALQVLPSIQPKAKHIINFVRSPIWVLPTISSGAKTFTKEEILSFATQRDKHTALRKYNESVVNSIFCKWTDSKRTTIAL
jgi:cation diffusion facilitator CzcD-associated flavoprotein CzcO